MNVTAESDRDLAERGGDPACWAHLVCRTCGQIPAGRPGPVCDTCGAPLGDD